jgi:hypothetical protein
MLVTLPGMMTDVKPEQPIECRISDAGDRMGNRYTLQGTASIKSITSNNTYITVKYNYTYSIRISI